MTVKIKTCMQGDIERQKFGSFLQTAKSIHADSGLTGFYRGATFRYGVRFGWDFRFFLHLLLLQCFGANEQCLFCTSLFFQLFSAWLVLSSSWTCPLSFLLGLCSQMLLNKLDQSAFKQK